MIVQTSETTSIVQFFLYLTRSTKFNIFENSIKLFYEIMHCNVTQI